MTPPCAFGYTNFSASDAYHRHPLLPQTQGDLRSGGVVGRLFDLQRCLPISSHGGVNILVDAAIDAPYQSGIALADDLISPGASLCMEVSFQKRCSLLCAIFT